MREKEYIHENFTPIEMNILGMEKEYVDGNNYYNPTLLSSITISITEACCLSCGHCSQSAPLGKGKEFSLAKMKEIVGDARDLGARYLGIFGGEPLLYPKLDEVISYSFEQGYQDIIIFSKGTLIDEKRARQLRGRGINKIQISCDSHIPEVYERIVGQKDTFVKFYKGIYALISAGINVLLKVIVTNKNIDTMPELIDYFISMGVKNIEMEVVVPVGRADFSMIPSDEKVDKLEQYIDMLKKKEPNKYRELNFKCLRYGRKKSCGGGITSLMVFADGDVAPCDKWFEYRKLFNFGNVYSNSIKEIWRDGIFKRFRNLTSDLKCKNCSKLYVCRGGCSLNNMILKLPLDRPDLACEKISGINKGQLFINE